MHATRGIVPRLAALMLLGALGCSSATVLKFPNQGDSLQVGRAPGPAFSWTVQRRTPFTLWLVAGEPSLGPRDEYTLTVARDASFSKASAVYTADRIRERRYMIPAGQGWLASGVTYFWKVEGAVRAEDGELGGEHGCKKPRSFRLEARETVAVDMKVPRSSGETSTQVVIGDETFTVDASFSLENGETRTVAITAWDGEKRITAGGKIWVVGVNENTRYGRINIDNLTLEELTRINAGDVGDFTYTLGGDEIVKMKLGSRIE
ncbi:MAG: hypothetical protein HY722_05045 [Planctomycetes bacterium]|nr:hypothetical protein [Planctomycetota bacterium]